MADHVDPLSRSRMMARVKGKDTKPEKVVRSILHRMGYRFRLHRKDLPGKPDIVLPRHKKIIFVHGCFWHGHEGCSRARRPSTNESFWNTKLNRNQKRDLDNQEILRRSGWKILILWECQIKDIENTVIILERFLNGDVEANTSPLKHFVGYQESLPWKTLRRCPGK
ncbi:MAG: very short patch repair endonuclease [Pseudomonadota bacterium]